MRSPLRFSPSPDSPNLFARKEERRVTHWTTALGEPPATHGERLAGFDGVTLRHFDPGRSKLAAGLANGWEGPLPTSGERWLYLGAAAGTTTSHVADMVGAGGVVYAMERSLRPFLRLLTLSERYPNILPVLGDARRPLDYLGSVPPVDGVYVDVAQPDQVELALDNARTFLVSGGRLLLALKTASMGRSRNAPEHLASATSALGNGFDLFRPVDLAPFHRRHYLLGGEATRALFREPAGTPAGARPTDRRAARRS
ncbi:MAG: fibrillarin-like rRNA/tRNA 2'-O-methyltransferase [Thermoplasmata archaeon]|nr:fibrillarin-like rRNA/tRNA 2'-O-methyltransferase [Thermoplasmata archaeon]